MIQRKQIVAVMLGAACASGALAAVSADEAKQLGTTLTLWGAEKAGNKEGTIPEYTGVPLKPPANFNPKEPTQHPSPFPDEKPLFIITAQNYSKYADKLDNAAEIFKRFPNYRMDVYPSHRSFVYPKLFLDNTVKNATSCKGIEGELKLEGCYGGYPFPIPKTGNQVMWNHLFQFEGVTYAGIVDQQVIPPNGPAAPQGIAYSVQNNPPFEAGKTGTLTADTVYWRVRTKDLSPARKAGGGVMILDYVDSLGKGRRAFQYIPGQRRVKLAPDLSYDTPSPYSGGSATMDDQKAFLGAQDRWDMKLIGKKEKFIPYNNFAIHDRNVCSTEKLVSTKNFPNPDCIRFELHRVWVVEATLKPGYRHVYHKRTFFWNEDVPGAGGTENYDAGGKLYRVFYSTSTPFYEAPGGIGGYVSPFFNTDLTTGIWAFSAFGTCAEFGCGSTPVADKPENFWSPEALASEGVR